MTRLRVASLTRSLRVHGPAERTLAGLVLAGAVLRAVATASWWPTIPTFADSLSYAPYAASNPLGDPQHPAGYSVFLRILGLLTREVAATTILQHLGGIATALLLFAAVRRLTGSPWPALLPAAFVLLGADQVYSEQLVASESLSALLLAAALYATVRALDSRSSILRWSVAAGALAAATTLTRTEAILVAPVLALGLLFSRRGPRQTEWRAAATLIGVWLILLVGYGAAKQIDTGEFVVGPAPGWQLYGRAATFADCRLFTPPSGTAGLCESTPAANRFGHDYYLYDPSSPAVRLFGGIGHSDGKLRAWALQAIEHQPGAYLTSVYHNLRDYFIPSTFAYVVGAGGGIDGEFDWAAVPTPKLQHDVIAGMETFFHRFRVYRQPRLVQALHDYQRVFRIGATLLTITALITVLALLVGPRRSRAGALVFGLGGLVSLLPPALVGAYLGRYTVPIAGPMGAAAGIGIHTLWGLEKLRRSDPEPVSPPFT